MSTFRFCFGKGSYLVVTQGVGLGDRQPWVTVLGPRQPS